MRIEMRTKVILTVAAAIVLAALFTGCQSGLTAATPINVAIVVSPTANAPVPAIQSKTVTEAINRSTASYGSVSVVISDGKPFVMASYDINPPDRSISDAKAESIAKAQAEQIYSVLSSAHAETPEVNTLAAIALAARSLSGSEGIKRILIMDTGLSTCGYVDFTKNLLRARGDAVVSYLLDMNALPNLDGMEILWVGLGDVSGAQDALTPSNLLTLREIWYDTLCAAGAASVSFEDDLPNGAVPDTSLLPAVTPVRIIPDDPFGIVGNDENSSFTGPYILDEEKILFHPDSSEFANRDAAVDALAPIADYLISHPNEQIVLVGTTATAGTREACASLSMARARAVMLLLIEMGVHEDQFREVYGLGYQNPFHVNDLNADGSLNANAPANRSVVILGVSSEYIQELSSYV